MRQQIIGIDKLILVSKDFSVSDALTPDFGIDTSKKQGTKDESLPYLLTDAVGREIRAHKIWHNTTQASITINQLGLNLSFNPDKIINPYQLSEINSSGFNDALSVVDKHLHKIGIKVNIEQMKLNRVDLAKQEQMNYSVWQYSDAFRLLASKRKMSKRTYLETQTIGNTQHQVCFYDKEQELSDLGLKNYITEKNLMRAEIRMLKSNCTKRIMHAETLKDLRRLHPADVSEIYSGYMQKNIFKGTISEQLMLNFDEEVDFIRHLKQADKRNAFKKYLMLKNLDEYLLRIGGIDNFLKLFTAAGFSRPQVWRYRNDLEQLLSLKAGIDKSRQDVSVSVLLDELKLKFAA